MQASIRPNVYMLVDWGVTREGMHFSQKIHVHLIIFLFAHGAAAGAQVVAHRTTDHLEVPSSSLFPFF